MPPKCHLHGPDEFKFVIDLSTDSEQPITIDKSLSPLSVSQDNLKTIGQVIDCRNAKTGEKIE
jgi:hypothetical protein